MASFADLRDAIIAVLDAELADVHLYAKVVDRANLPAIVVQPGPAEFPLEMGRATDTWQFELNVMTAWSDAELAQDTLDAFLSGGGATSIRQIFMRNRQLGRTDVVAAYVAGMSDYGAHFTMAGVDNVGCKLQMIVKTKAPDWE
jgi:hypothetical protein